MDVTTLGSMPEGQNRPPPHLSCTKHFRHERRSLGKVKLYELASVAPSPKRPRSLNKVRIEHLQNLWRYRVATYGRRLRSEEELGFLKVAAPHLRAVGGEPPVRLWVETRCPQAIAELGIDHVLAVAAASVRYVRARAAGIMLDLAFEERELTGVWSFRYVGQTAEDLREAKRERDRKAARKAREAAGARRQSESLSRLEPWKHLGISRSTFYSRSKEERERLVGQLRRCQYVNATASDETVQPVAAPVAPRAVEGTPSGAPATPTPAVSGRRRGLTRVPGLKPERPGRAVLVQAPDRSLPSWQELSDWADDAIRLLGSPRSVTVTDPLPNRDLSREAKPAGAYSGSVPSLRLVTHAGSDLTGGLGLEPKPDCRVPLALARVSWEARDGIR